MSVDPPIPLDPNFRIQLPLFEGPLDLLLHLIQRHELPILDLPVAFVTERYLEYLDTMRTLDLDVAAEYLVMAATLVHLKSRMLLPAAPAENADDEAPEDEADPRAELIRRLLEYQKYKRAAQDLGALGVAGRDVFFRGTPAPDASGPPELAEVGVFRLLDAFQRMLKRAQREVAFEISNDRIGIQERIAQIVERMSGQSRCRFDELFDDIVTTYDVVVTFLAILEMAKRRTMRIVQVDAHADILLEYRPASWNDPASSEDAEPAADVAAEEPSTPSEAARPASPDLSSFAIDSDASEPAAEAWVPPDPSWFEDDDAPADESIFFEPMSLAPGAGSRPGTGAQTPTTAPLDANGGPPLDEDAAPSSSAPTGAHPARNLDPDTVDVRKSSPSGPGRLPGPADDSS